MCSAHILSSRSPNDLIFFSWKDKISVRYLVALPTILELCSDSKLVDTITIEDFSEDEALEEALSKKEQLGFSFSDDDCCDGSPLPSPLAAPALPLATLRGSSPPISSKVVSSLPSVSSSREWRNLFSSGQPTSYCTKL